MKKTRNIFTIALMTVLMAALFIFAANNLNANASVIRPYNPAQSFELTVSYNSGSLEVSTTNVAGHSYQYWVKTNVATDDSVDLKQSNWMMKRGFGGYTASIPISNDNIDENGTYNVIVRIKDNAERIVEELFGAYTPAQIGKPVISEVKVNGKSTNNETLIIEKSSSVNVTIIANIKCDSYAFYLGESDVSIMSNQTGIFNITNLSLFKTGLHKIRTEISKNGSKDLKYISVYFYDEFVANKIPVIKSLVGEPDVLLGEGGLTLFTMQVRYADDTDMVEGDKNNFSYSLISENRKGTVETKTVTNGTLYVTFKVDYQNNHGIYMTTATVLRNEISAVDDKKIIYYKGYARDADIEQIYSASNNPLTTGTEITINAVNAYIDGVLPTNLEYAFYREDASGWILMRTYGSKELVWTPARPGTYNIQVRVKDSSSDTYEEAVTRTYIIIGVNLDGELSVNVRDYQTNNIVNAMYAGRPYKFEAAYSGTEDVLYMFTLYSNDLNTVYLNKYTTLPYFMFIPNKVDNYIITARVINYANFGFKDKAQSISISSSIKPFSIPQGYISAYDSYHYNTMVGHNIFGGGWWNGASEPVAEHILSGVTDAVNGDSLKVTVTGSVNGTAGIRLLFPTPEEGSLSGSFIVFRYKGVDRPYVINGSWESDIPAHLSVTTDESGWKIATIPLWMTGNSLYGLQSMDFLMNIASGTTHEIYFDYVKGAYKLETPINLAYTDGLLSWSAVDNASSYVVNVNGTEYAGITDTSYQLSAGEYVLKVKAIGDKITYFDSDYSSEKAVLIQPQGYIVDYNSDIYASMVGHNVYGGAWWNGASAPVSQYISSGVTGAENGDALKVTVTGSAHGTAGIRLLFPTPEEGSLSGSSIVFRYKGIERPRVINGSWELDIPVHISVTTDENGWNTAIIPLWMTGNSLYGLQSMDFLINIASGTTYDMYFDYVKVQ